MPEPTPAHDLRLEIVLSVSEVLPNPPGKGKSSIQAQYAAALAVLYIVLAPPAATKSTHGCAE